jgi:hypothetical protein
MLEAELWLKTTTTSTTTTKKKKKKKGSPQNVSKVYHTTENYFNRSETSIEKDNNNGSIIKEGLLPTAIPIFC